MSRRAPAILVSVLLAALLVVAAFGAGRAYERVGGFDGIRATLADGRRVFADDHHADARTRPPKPTREAWRRDEAASLQRLRGEIAGLAPQRPGHPDLFVLGIAGDGSEQVFLNEVNHLRALAGERLDARGHVLLLANHAPAAPAAAPVPATRATVRAALAAIGDAMDPAEDILLLYATTHGSQDHWLLLRRDGWPDATLDAHALRRALDDAGIRHRVLVLSACFSGGFAAPLQTPDTLFLAAARADRPSFGCGTGSVATFFGRAWLVDAMNTTVDFAEAFRRARAAIAMREAAVGEDPSFPQLREGARIGATLARWRAAFAPGAPVAYPFAEPGYASPEPASSSR